MILVRSLVVRKASYKIEAPVVHKALPKAFFNTFPRAALCGKAVLREVVLCRPCADFNRAASVNGRRDSHSKPGRCASARHDAASMVGGR